MIAADAKFLEHPKPSEIYDIPKLRYRLKYADYTLRNPQRKQCPIGMRALLMYKEACKGLLNLEIQLENTEEGQFQDDDKGNLQDLKTEWLATIRIYEESIQFRACLQTTPTLSTQEL